jgi:hypothetical protein
MKAPSLALLASVIVTPVCIAQAETLKFLGTAPNACALTSPQNGVINLQGDLKSWATTAPATLAVTNTGYSQLTVTRDNDWLSAPSGAPATSFNHTAWLVGPTSGQLQGAGTAKSITLTLAGSSTLSVFLSAVAETPFVGGDYEYQVTVTCAPY